MTQCHHLKHQSALIIHSHIDYNQEQKEKENSPEEDNAATQKKFSI